MKLRKKLFLFFSLLVVFCFANTLRAQSISQSSVGIALSEYCVSNIGGTGSPQSDFFGNRSDWVEIYSNFSAVVNLSTYYLSNDKNNLFKWKFPAGASISPGQTKIVWLSGRNTTPANGEYHANFTLDQCKGQFLTLTTAQGTVRDSVMIQRTKEGHSRGRVDFTSVGRSAWRVFPTPTFSLTNFGSNYINYAPQPIMKFISAPLSPTFSGVNAGGFYPANPGIANAVNFYLENGLPYDTLNTCFRIYYTIDNGNYPVVGTPTTIKLLDSNSILMASPATLIRAISVPFSSGNVAAPSGCEQQYLPSFCETNTYFTDIKYQEFSEDFGVVSIAMDQQDTSWFNSNGASRKLVHVEYYDKKTQISEGYTEINRPVQEAWLTKQKGFYMTIDDRRGFGCNFEGDIFNVDGLGTSQRNVFPTLHLKAGDYESHSLPLYSPTVESKGTGIMDVFYQSLAAKNNLNVNPLHIKPVVAFINGLYQGVYDLREVYDKHYENFYNKQSLDSLDLRFYRGGDGFITYSDGLGSNFSGDNAFVNQVYNLGISSTISNPTNYNNLLKVLDKESFIDYMILNSYAMNGNLWKYDYDIAFAKGGQSSKPGFKWHYYLWNTPSIFNFTALSLPGAQVYPDVNVSPCFVHTYPDYNSVITPLAGNGHGKILNNLMSTAIRPIAGTGRFMFQQDYIRRYQDLLNGPLKCENILKHYDYVKNLYFKEMQYHEDAASLPNAGLFTTAPTVWDTNTTVYRRGIEKRCKTMSEAFGKKFVSCYGLSGPYALTVDVQPAGAGRVQLNSITLDNYIWSGSYYGAPMSLKAVPADQTYAFHHWEFKTHSPNDNRPLSVDSVAIDFSQADQIVAVFTDKKNDVTMPSGFTPNGDGINDLFQPLGSAQFSKDFDMSVWNRWGQEVFRSTDPSKGWDGYFKGQQAQTGVYAYLITYKNLYNESKILKGNLTLLR